MPDSYVIDARRLRKEYGKKLAVSDLTLQVKPGEAFGFLGPNGAGKTTAVKMLLGLVHRTAGEAHLLGRPIGHVATRSRIGYLPEHFRFYEWLQANEFLDLHGRLLGMSHSQRSEQIPSLLQLVGLGRRSGTRLSAFSKGMLQRIGLAQALLNDPDLVFLDEPTSGLDPLGRMLVRDIVGRLRDEGKTVFINSHLLSEVEMTCDRVAFIRAGVVLSIEPLAAALGDQVELTLKIDRTDVQLLEGLQQVAGGLASVADDGRVTVSVDSSGRIPQVAAWLIGQGVALYEMRPRHITLEERFLAVVGDEVYEA